MTPDYACGNPKCRRFNISVPEDDISYDECDACRGSIIIKNFGCYCITSKKEFCASINWPVPWCVKCGAKYIPAKTPTTPEEVQMIKKPVVELMKEVQKVVDVKSPPPKRVARKALGGDAARLFDVTVNDKAPPAAPYFPTPPNPETLKQFEDFRIQHRNPYNDLVAQPKEECPVKETCPAMSEPVKQLSKYEVIKATAIDEGKDALWRITAEQYLETVRTPIHAALFRNLGIADKGKSSAVARTYVLKFLESEPGEAVFTYALSFTTQFLPYHKNIAQRISRELRVMALARVGGKILNTFMSPMRAAMDVVISGMPIQLEQSV